MRMHLRPLLCLGLLLVSCEKPPKVHVDEGQEATPPAVTKSRRTPRETSPEMREKVRSALERAKLVSSIEERDKAVAAIAWENLELDPELALEAFQQLAPGSRERIRLIQHFAMRLAEEDVEKAVKWADTLGNPEEISLAYGKISLVLAETEPERAANLISESGMAGREFDVALVQVIQRWAASEPAHAAAWVALFDPGEARSAGLKTVVSLWARSDTAATLTWIGSLQNEGLREEAKLAMAEAILQQPPSVQDEWKQLVTPEIRAAFEKLKQQADKEAAE